MQLTAHFRLGEFTKSRTALANGIDNTLTNESFVLRPSIIENLKAGAIKLENIRTVVNKPIIITSGYRHPELNRLVGGVATSQHQWGCAVDIECPGLSTKEFHQVIMSMGLSYDQCILEYYNNKDPYSGWVHFGYLRCELREDKLIPLDLRQQSFSIK